MLSQAFSLFPFNILGTYPHGALWNPQQPQSPKDEEQSKVQGDIAYSIENRKVSVGKTEPGGRTVRDAA
jgi:hypothetical protein